MNQLKKENKKMKEENKEITTKICGIENMLIRKPSKIKINNNGTIDNSTNKTVNIQLVAFGKENLEEFVSDSVCKKILFRGFEAVPLFVEYVHFNKKKPEYHNCYISNMRDNNGIIYNGKNWELMSANDLITTLKETSESFLGSKFDKLYDTLDEPTQTKFGRYLQEQDTKELKLRYKDSLQRLLYNKRHTVLNTKANMALLEN
jgi:hypothetical protein